MKRVISFCLWGSDPVYWDGALENARLAAALFPGWECWYYVASEGISQSGLAGLRDLPNARVIIRDGEGDASVMLWRFEPADDPDVELFLSRDTDSRLSEREKRSVEAWLSSGRQYHVMRDHPYHRVAMLGGMWGRRNSGSSQFKQWMFDWLAEGREIRKGIDQEFLREVVWPLAKKSCMVHDPFFSGRWFPDSIRCEEGVFFCGECFTKDNHPTSMHDRETLRNWEKKWKYLKWWRRLHPVKF